MSDYPPAVDALLNLGRDRLEDDEGVDYRAMGIGPEHVPDLMRLARAWLADLDELDEDEETPPSFFGPIHAWRALGQLQAIEAIPALLDAFRRDRVEDGDWSLNELQEVFSKLGPPVLPALTGVLQERYEDEYIRWTIADAIKLIAQKFPDRRAECIALIAGQLEKASENTPTLNGGLISALMDLEAVETAPIIEAAFATENVDEFMAGDWEQVRYELGLGPPPARKQTFFKPDGPTMPRSPSPKGRAEQRKKQRKQAKQSKKRNRRKK
jgi:hypothetical protein